MIKLTYKLVEIRKHISSNYPKIKRNKKDRLEEMCIQLTGGI